MAIKQERLINLLYVARDLLEKAQVLARHAERVRHVANTNQSVEALYDLLLELCAGIEAIKLTDPETIKHFYEEEAHFKFNAQRNKRQADYMKRYRARIRLRDEADTEEAYILQQFGIEKKPEVERELLRPRIHDREKAMKMITELPGPETQPTSKGTDEEYEEEIAKPVGKGRNPMLDQITIDFMYTRLKLIQEQTKEGPTSSDIANLYRKGGADEDEVGERTAFWISELKKEGLIEPTLIPYQYKVLDR